MDDLAGCIPSGEETLVVERTVFDCPHVCVTEQDNLVIISTSKLTAYIHLEPFYVEVRDTAEKKVFSTPQGETLSWKEKKLTQRFDLPKETCVYGLGQSSIADLDLRGWVTWWKLAGAYRYGPEGFDAEFLPEKQLCIDEKNLEPGVRVEDFKRFECFGYVPVQRVFKEEKNVSASANFTLNCIDRTCYASCTAILPEDRECTVKLMGEDKLKLWVNGKLQLASDLCHGTPLYSRVKLKAGKNRIFIKCSQFHNREAEVWSERAWGFFFTIVDENRKPMEDIVYCAE